MADPTRIVDNVAPIYAQELGEDWETMSEERKLKFRALAFKIYEVHVRNKFEGLDLAVNIIEGVQTAPSTPKSWLRGVQEAKNALKWMIEGLRKDIETRVTVPEILPEDFNAIDEYEDLRAGDLTPEIVPHNEQCGHEHEDAWTCTRRKHPDHWHHWDDDLGLTEEEMEDEEFMSAIDGRILATWKYGERLDSLHPALGDLEDDL